MPSHNLATVTDVADRPAPLAASDVVEPKSVWADVAVVLLGVVMTMCACGYEFGHGDHDSYFPEAIHTAFPKLLAHDWYTVQTLSYHPAFAWMTATLMRLHIVRPAFLTLYLALVAVLQIGWMSIVRRVGGSRSAYVASVSLWLMIEAGRSLASYHMLQDSELLAANIAGVSMLVGFAFWIRGRFGRAGAAFGIAGLFHLNYAVAALAGWCVLAGLQWLDARRPAKEGSPRPAMRSLAIGTGLLLLGVLPNILHAVPAALKQKHGMPFADFLDVYVHFRHPHHYDPRTWTISRWLEFGWTIPPAIALGLIWLQRPTAAATAFARREAVRIYLGLSVAVGIGLVFAGVWFVSATLVQLSLSRFGVYIHLFGCTAAALLLCDVIRMPRPVRLVGVGLLGVGVSTAMIGSLFIHYGQLADPISARDFLKDFIAAKAGLALMSFAPLGVLAIDRARRRPMWVYPLAAVGLLILLGAKRNAWHGEFDHSDNRPTALETFDWIASPKHTPINSVFLTSPTEQVFTIRAERAMVVCFKCPPQLTNELPEWRDRMCAVMNIASLQPLVPMQDKLFDAMDQYYDAVPFDQLRRVAARYGATYVLLHHELPINEAGKPVYVSLAGPYYLYKLNPQAATLP